MATVPKECCQATVMCNGYGIRAILHAHAHTRKRTLQTRTIVYKYAQTPILIFDQKPNCTVCQYHYHLAEKFGYIDSKGHVGDDFLNHLKVALGVPLDLEASQQRSLERR